jgi:hypothetical protein
LSFPTGISVSVGGLQVEFQHREVIFDAMGPFYLRRKGVLRIGKEKGEAIVEDMHAAKFAGWYLKSAAATAAEDVGVDRTFLQDAANALRTSARIQAKIIRRIGDRTRRRVARRELLDVAGKIGGTADFHLEVSNSEESSVELTTSYFVEDAEGQRLPVRLSMEPRRADLKPDGSVTLQGRIDLDPTVFRAGLVYFGELEVRGGRDVLREVDLEIRPAD